MKKKQPVLIFACCILLATACTNQNKKNDAGFQFKDEVKQSDIEVTKSFIYLFPSPGEILDRFYNADIQYVEEALNDPDKVDNYLSTRDKSLNLGVYLTDMAYSALFTRSSEAVDFLDVIQKLSTELNVSSTAFETLIDRAKENLGIRDSLVTISNEVFFNMVEFLEGSGQENTIAVISCGAYVESMYLAMSSIDEYTEDDPIIHQISELKYPMENLLSHAETVSDDPNVQSILKYISELNDIFSQLEAESSKVSKTEPGVLTFSGGSAPELNKDNFDLMKSKVISIRELIVGK